jgi:hypothetical protein
MSLRVNSNSPLVMTIKTSTIDHFTPSIKKSSLPLTVLGSAREVRRYGAANAGSRHIGLEANAVGDITSLNSTETQGYFREPET